MLLIFTINATTFMIHLRTCFNSNTATCNFLSLFFVVLAFHKLVLHGFDRHFQATVHFPVSSAIVNNIDNSVLWKTLGMLRFEPSAT